jgi:uncharacterized membrane protein YdbT with pleckstrin-like domain
MSLLALFHESTNSFDGQEAGEKVVMLVRRHPFYIAMKFIFTFLLAIFPAFVASAYAPILIVLGIGDLTLFLLTVWVLVLWMIFFYHFTMYTLDVWIVTDRRIIDSTQHGFFNRTVSELHASRVQDVSVQVNGLIQTLFHFGDIQVQTAGTEEKFRFIQVPHPEEIKNEIMKFTSAKNPANSV